MNDIPHFPGYRANGVDGSIWSCWNFVKGGTFLEREMTNEWKQLKPQRDKKTGRARYRIRHESGAIKQIFGSHLVLMAFVSLRPIGLIACHKDDNCKNDALTNLKWGTHKDNADDASKNWYGSPNAKVNEAEIEDIKDRRQDGESAASIAEDYGLHITTVYKILKDYK